MIRIILLRIVYNLGIILPVLSQIFPQKIRHTVYKISHSENISLFWQVSKIFIPNYKLKLFGERSLLAFPSKFDRCRTEAPIFVVGFQSRFSHVGDWLRSGTASMLRGYVGDYLVYVVWKCYFCCNDC